LARALWALKYRGRLDVGRRLARVLADHVPFEATEHDLVLPVPLHKARLRERGFNHACILAAAVARRFRKPLGLRALRRIRPTQSQVSLPEASRTSNVRGAFAVTDPAAIEGRRVVLVDDVYTTGATVAECAVVLRRAGAAAVDVLTLARAVRY
jgi:ComF family protein